MIPTAIIAMLHLGQLTGKKFVVIDHKATPTLVLQDAYTIKDSETSPIGLMVLCFSALGNPNRKFFALDGLLLEEVG